MARKTFISYKYSEARPVRDAIFEALGEDGRYYRGETSYSPDFSDKKTETIRGNLKNMIYGTSVSVVILSPYMRQSNWIDWEIEYSLKSVKRGDKTSGANGVVGVIGELDGSYDWMVSSKREPCGCNNRCYRNEYLPRIITENRHNRKERVKKDAVLCEACGAISGDNGSYISLVEQNIFIRDPAKYIEIAYNKSKNTEEYYLRKTIDREFV
jgi:hypothetical protein